MVGRSQTPDFASCVHAGQKVVFNQSRIFVSPVLVSPVLRVRVWKLKTSDDALIHQKVWIRVRTFTIVFLR